MRDRDLSDFQLFCEVEECYRRSFRPNDVPPTTAEFLDFIDYMFSFYGHESFDPVYPEYGFTFREVCQGMIARFGYRPALDWDGDSVDREIVRDMILDIREREGRLPVRERAKGAA